jgi:hypothetical protein
VKNSHDAIFGALYELPATVPRLGELPCRLTDVPSHYSITVAWSKKRAAAATLERVASSQRDVREQSPLKAAVWKTAGFKSYGIPSYGEHKMADLIPGLDTTPKCYQYISPSTTAED